MTLEVESSIEFAKTAALPEVEDFGLEIESGDPPNFDKPELAVTVGSQIASFASDVEPELREKIANGFLFAQQAANKQIEGAADASTLAWYKTYVHVLTQIGWMTEEDAKLDRIIKGTSVQVHKEVIPIITAALGPAAAASALVVKVLEGLSQMDADSRWFTIFDSASQRAQANQFQMSTHRQGRRRAKDQSCELRTVGRKIGQAGAVLQAGHEQRRATPHGNRGLSE